MPTQLRVLSDPVEEMAGIGDRPVILFLDAGTGKGGASRSLYYLIAALDRTRWEPHVLLLAGNPLVAWYDSLGVSVTPLPGIPRFRPGERKNPIAFAHFLWRMRHYPAVLKAARKALAGRAGLLHANHENLALTCRWLAAQLKRPWVCHIRTTLVDTWFARRIYRFILRRADRVVFISDGVAAHFEKLCGIQAGKHCRTVFNAYRPEADPVEPLNLRGDPDRQKLRVLTLSNITPNRGIDRQLDVAAVLKKRGITDILLVVCGGPQHRSLKPNAEPGYYEQILTRVEEEELGAVIEFTGHVHPPERALVACDVLMKLGRENVPWGRDLIEAMTFGLPIVTLGTFETVVENGVNGFIDAEFDTNRVVGHLLRLRDDENLRQTMAVANQRKAERMFAPEASAAAIESIYDELR